MEVTGWQAPLASLFYRATREEASYLAPEGEMRGRLRLKRRLVIDHGQLTHLADDLDTRPAALVPGDPVGAPGAPPGGPAAGLAGALSGPASPWLQDIIATIQPEQFELIAAPGDEVLVVQGVAGSGKTSIALHRLSFLGYPDLAAGRLAPRCLVFGPNRLFLQYISAVLPRLGLRHAEQTTIADWALARLFPQGPTPRPRLVDPTFEALLDPATPSEKKDALSRVSRLKTSSRMGLLLQRYVEWRRQGIDIPPEGWPVRQTVEGRPLRAPPQRRRAAPGPRALPGAALRPAPGPLRRGPPGAALRPRRGPRGDRAAHGPGPPQPGAAAPPAGPRAAGGRGSPARRGDGPAGHRAPVRARPPPGAGRKARP